MLRSDLAHTQIFFDGHDLYMSHFAIDAYRKRRTYAVTPPIKEGRIDKFKARGMSVEETPFVIYTDAYSKKTAHNFASLHSALSAFPHEVSSAVGTPPFPTMSTSVDSAMALVQKQANAHWKPDRLLHMKSINIGRDADMLAYVLDAAPKDQLLRYLDNCDLYPTDVPSMQMVSLPCGTLQGDDAPPMITALWMINDQALCDPAGPKSEADDYYILPLLAHRFDCAITWPPVEDIQLITDRPQGHNRYAVFYLMYDPKRNVLTPYICEYRLQV